MSEVHMEGSLATPQSRRMHRMPGRAEVRVLRDAKAPTARLFCFPYAGAGPSIFNAWKARLPASVAVYGMVYPGRECRSDEPPFTDLSMLVDQLQGGFAELDDVPFALFGYSMGAYVAVELARRLERRGAGPAHLFVSAAGAPHLPEPNKIHHLPPAEFFRALVKLNGFPPEVLQDPQLVTHALPILRADFTACETYRFNPDVPVRCPVTAFGGIRDGRVTQARVAAWRHLAGTSFSMKMFDGDHFFLRERQAEMLACIDREFIRTCR